MNVLTLQATCLVSDLVLPIHMYASSALKGAARALQIQGCLGKAIALFLT